MIAIIDYGMGNLMSVYKAFISLGFDAIITKDKDKILSCDKIVLPGVGAFKDAIDTIKKNGIDTIIYDAVQMNKPILGICLGMQLLFEESYEFGLCKGLGLIKGKIVKFENCYDGINYKIPHIGWNDISIVGKSKLFDGIKNNSFVYFVHSYYLASSNDAASTITEYGIKFTSSVEYNNIYGVQFHPEKSGDLGLKILKNFGDL